MNVTRIEFADGRVVEIPTDWILRSESGSVANKDGYLVATLSLQVAEVRRVTQTEKHGKENQG